MSDPYEAFLWGLIWLLGICSGLAIISGVLYAVVVGIGEIITWFDNRRERLNG